MLLVFTDLDGTIIDFKSYEYKEAIPYLKLLKKLGVPLIIVTSKTRKEMNLWRKRLNIIHPYVVENGGAIFIHRGYRGWRLSWPIKENYWYKVLGFKKDKLRKGIRELKREKNFLIKPLSSLSVKEVCKLTGLSVKEAKLAMEREYSEPFLLIDGNFEEMEEKAKRLGFRVIRGRRFLHLTGPSDKGKAVKTLKKLYTKMENTEVVTAAIGDSTNDFPMLMEVDLPYLVEKETGIHEKITSSRVIKIFETGPKGWSKAIEKILEFQNFKISGG